MEEWFSFLPFAYSLKAVYNLWVQDPLSYVFKCDIVTSCKAVQGLNVIGELLDKSRSERGMVCRETVIRAGVCPLLCSSRGNTAVGLLVLWVKRSFHTCQQSMLQCSLYLNAKWVKNQRNTSWVRNPGPRKIIKSHRSLESFIKEMDFSEPWKMN